MIYTVEYWKYGLPHQFVKRKAFSISNIKGIDYIISTSYKIRFRDDKGNIIAEILCD